MNIETHRQLANFIWSICNLLRGPYKRNEYRKVILPLTVLRRFDCLLAPTKIQALATFNEFKTKPESIIRSKMSAATGYPFYNLSKLEFAPSQKDRNSLLDDPSNLAPNLNSYINGFSPNVRAIMERFAFDQQIAKMADKNLLYKVVQEFTKIDLSPDHIDNMQMGYVFEELIRIGAEQSNEEAGEHFTPREVIKLMVNLLLSPEQDLRRSHVVKTIYDPACGTGGMLSVAEKYIRDLNNKANPLLYGQDWNDEAWAVCRADMLIKGEDADNIAQGDTFTKDAHARDEQGQRRTFDYMLANPPFGVEWKQQQRYIEHERDTLGYQGRFGAGSVLHPAGAELFGESNPDMHQEQPVSYDMPSPFKITENIIYDPPHVSPRIRAQDGVLMACWQPMRELDDNDYLEIIIKQGAHDDIRRRLDQYGVFDKQLFPDLDGIAKWLKYRAYEIDGTI